MSMTDEMIMSGYIPKYNYTQYANDNNVNVIPEVDFKRLVTDTFKVIADTMKNTYGPYGSTVCLLENGETGATKDGYNTFCGMNFNDPYKHHIYLAIKAICERVNNNVGDGTTSCILLAEKIFRFINSEEMTPDQKRKVLKILSGIEANLNNPEILKYHEEIGQIHKLSRTAFESAIKMAANGDEKLAQTLVEAFDPKYDYKGIVTRIRNVVCDMHTDRTGSGDTNLEIKYLSGKYRIGVKMDTDLASRISGDTKAKIVIYDHSMTEGDWVNFMADFKNDGPVIIIARDFTKIVYNNYGDAIRRNVMMKEPINLYLCKIVSDHTQTDLKDLSAILKTDANTLVVQKPIDHDKLPSRLIRIENNNCLCFMDLTEDDIPKSYIQKITEEMEAEINPTYVCICKYIARINELKLDSEDTLLNLTGSSTLELKMLSDKINDCTSIIKSAMNSGIVPNLLVYGYSRICNLSKNKDMNEEVSDEIKSEYELETKLYEHIKEAIIGLFYDIWVSKHGTSKDEEFQRLTTGDDSIYNIMYNKSFDIITEKSVDCASLATSAQYDIEVIIAAISIVKYLITSKALIFNSTLLQQYKDIPSGYEKM